MKWARIGDQTYPLELLETAGFTFQIASCLIYILIYDKLGTEAQLMRKNACPFETSMGMAY